MKEYLVVWPGNNCFVMVDENENIQSTTPFTIPIKFWHQPLKEFTTYLENTYGYCQTKEMGI